MTTTRVVGLGPDTLATLTSIEWAWTGRKRVKELTFTIQPGAQVNPDHLLLYL